MQVKAALGATLVGAAAMAALLTACPDIVIPPPDVPKPAGPRRATVTLCSQENVPQRQAMGIQNALQAVSRFSNTSYGNGYAISLDLVPYAKCPQLIEPTCTATQGVVYCDAISLARIMTASALMASAWTQQSFNEWYRFGERPSASVALPSLGALDLTDDLYQPDGGGAGFFGAMRGWQGSVASLMLVPKMAGIIQRADATAAIDVTAVKEELEPLAGELDPNNPLGSQVAREDMVTRFGTTLEIYEGASNMIMASLLGHELSHAHSSCAETEPSEVEARGILDRVVRAQSHDAFSCNRTAEGITLIAGEVAAEQCGLRVLRRMLARMRVERATKSGLRAFANGPQSVIVLGSAVATQTMATLLSLGLEGRAPQVTAQNINQLFDGRQIQRPASRLSPGYLAPFLRAFLFAEELRLGAPFGQEQLQLCGDAAALFVESADRLATQCGAPVDTARKALLDALGDASPKAIRRVWEAPGSPPDLACAGPVIAAIR